MKITVVGVGYVGMSMATLLAQKHDVTAVTRTPAKADMINRYESPIRDDEIDRFFNEAKADKRKLSLHATTDQDSAINEADLLIVAVPTDCNEEEGRFDTKAVEDVIGNALNINPEVPIVIKSTIPMGFTSGLRSRHKTARIIFSPEFLRESKALYDNLHPSRIIVGADDDLKEEAQLFAELLIEGAGTEEERSGSKPQDIPVLFTHPTEAEAVKLFANTYLATRISFFNELDTYACLKGLDSKEIIQGVCMDPRIGDHYNNPSFGYGGYCLPKDTKELLFEYKDVPQTLVDAVVKSNPMRKEFIANQILEAEPETVGVYRLIMKSGSDNFRESAVLDIVGHLRRKGINVIIYEPSLENGSAYLGCKVINDMELFKEKSDIIIANRVNIEDLGDVMDKVYTRDVFGRD